MAREKALQFIDHEAEKMRVFVAHAPGKVRGQKHVGQVDNLAVGRDRLRVEDIKARSNIAALEALDQGRRVEDRPARHVHQEPLPTE